MILKKSESENSCTYYVQKSFRTNEGKYSSKIVERLGSMEEMEARFGKGNTMEKAKEYVSELTRQSKLERERISFSFSPSMLLKQDERHSFNGGYLFLKKIYYELGLDKICEKISARHRVKYDLNEILSNLLYTRVIYPGSKRSSLDDAGHFLEHPSAKIHQVYRTLSLLSKENDFIQSAVYQNSLKLGRRNSKVLYYDCTNYFFESEEENGLRQYGVSKEHRPNPIVQMGLFVDTEGFPLAFSINPGNTNEQVTLKPLEQKLNDNFGMSKLVICTDAGLSSYENRKSNNVADRAFITVQSLKKLKHPLQEWALNPHGWSVFGMKSKFDIDTINPKTHRDILFYKERWINENGIEQRIIVTFSFKYRDYLQCVRNRQIDRARQMLKKGPSMIKKTGQNDPKRFIAQSCCTPNGELAQMENYSLNREMIEQEAKFDGFYAICTDLEDNALSIIETNSGRWQIENVFRIMKTEFEARPVFLQRDDRIIAHFLTCFLALLLYKYLEKKINRGRNHFTPREITKTLAEMNFFSVSGEGYIPTYTRNDLTNALNGSAGFRTDTEIVSKKTMRSIIAATKKR